MQDKRSEPRQRIVLQGEIISGNGLRMSCAIRDISDRGARVSVVTPFHVTDRLALLIPARHKLAMARVRWRKGTHLGLAFISVAEITPDSAAQDLVA
ncbi:MAG: PilZ domain-containing protein [Microvirga sp.]